MSVFPFVSANPFFHLMIVLSPDLQERLQFKSFDQIYPLKLSLHFSTITWSIIFMYKTLRNDCWTKIFLVIFPWSFSIVLIFVMSGQQTHLPVFKQIFSHFIFLLVAIQLHILNPYIDFNNCFSEMSSLIIK